MEEHQAAVAAETTGCVAGEQPAAGPTAALAYERRGVASVALLTVLLMLLVGATLPASASADGQAIVNAAASQAGMPYCWDGGNESGPTHGSGGSGCGGTTVGFDCTGLAIYAVYQGTGISGLPHDGAGNLWAAKGAIITDQSQLAPGDIVFFGGSFSNFEHAGIYAGGGMVWDADDYNVPVQEHSLAWIEHALPFVGAVSYSGGGQSGALPDGSLVRTPDGSIFRIVGGAPLHISRCDYTNNCQGVVAVSNLNAYLTRPRNGALIRNVDNGDIFEVVGGAPLHLGSCTYTSGGNCSGAVNVDSYPIAALDHLNAVPANGALIRNGDNGAIYEVVGGAPLHLGSCQYTGGGNCGEAVNVDGYPIAALDHLNAVPSDGSLIRDGGSGAIYEVVGGAPLHLGTCQYTDCSLAVNVDNYPINALDHLNAVPSNGSLIRNGDNGAIYEVVGGAPLHLGSCAYTDCGQAVNVDSYPINALDHLNAVPSNGSLIRNGDNGAIYEVVGGAPLHLGSCAYTDCGQAVNVDSYPINALDHLNAVPSNGSFVRNGDNGAEYRVAGGAALKVTDCAALGGCTGEITIDSTALTQLDHLRAAPADGTILIGEPSGQAWLITGGVRTPTNSTTGVGINDATVATIPTPPSSGTGPTGLSPGGGSTVPGTTTTTSSTPTSATPASSSAPLSGNTGSTGTRAKACVVPSLRHLTTQQAARALTRASCRLGKTRRPRHVPKHRTLRVTAQSALAHSRHKPGYTVNITVTASVR